MLKDNLVDVAVHCTYQTDHGARTWVTPVILVPACANCFAACSRNSITCGNCRRYVCGKCDNNRVAFNDFRDEVILCCACAGQQDTCSSNASSEWTDSSDGSGHCDASTYRFLRKVWHHMATARLKDGYWVTMAHLDGFIAAPVKDIGTWMVMSLKLASRYPRGIAVFQLDSQRCIVCAPGQTPAQANVKSALSWIRDMGDAAIGIAVRGSSFACLSVRRDMNAACVQEHRGVVINAASTLSFAEF